MAAAAAVVQAGAHFQALASLPALGLRQALGQQVACVCCAVSAVRRLGLCVCVYMRACMVSCACKQMGLFCVCMCARACMCLE